MEEIKGKNPNEINNPNSFDGFYLTALLFKHKIFIISFVIACTIAGTIIALYLPNEYKAVVTAVPPKQNNSMLEGALSNISSAMKEFGMTKMGSKSGDYDFIVVLSSRTLKDSLINRYDLKKHYEIEDTLYSSIIAELDDRLEISLETEGNYAISVIDKDPNTAVKMTKSVIEYANLIAKTIFRREATLSRIYLEQRINSIDSVQIAISQILKDYSKKNMVISPIDQAKAVSSSLAELKAEKINQEVMYQLFVYKYGENDPYTQSQKKLLNEISAKLVEAETKPGFAGNFALTDAAEVGINYLTLYAQLEAVTKVKAFLLPMLEQYKLEEVKEMNSLFILDEPITPQKKERPKRSLIVAGTCLGSFVLACIFVLIINSIKHFRIKYRDFKNNQLI